MKRIAVAHLKGGVGKTTTAVNLAHLASRQGYRTLLVDLDAQGAASYILRVDGEAAAKAKDVIRAKKDILEHIYATDYPELDILPGSLSLRKLPQLLAKEKDGGDGLDTMFKRIGKGYDLMIADAPAGLNLESEAILRSVDLVVVPVVPSPLATATFETLRRFVKGMDVEVVGFYSMVDRRRKLHRETVEAKDGIRDVLPISVPNASAVERMTSERMPLAAVSRAGNAMGGYLRLWEELVARLGLSSPKSR